MAETKNDGNFYLVDCADVIEQEVAAGLPQKAVALTYALAMRSAAAGMWEAGDQLWVREGRYYTLLTQGSGSSIGGES